MKAIAALGGLVVALSLETLACAAPRHDDEVVASGADAIVTASSCTVDKDGTLYQAKADVTNEGLFVRLDGVARDDGTLRDKNNIDVETVYESGAKSVLTMPDDQKGNERIKLPLHVEAKARYTIKVTFDVAGDDKSCTIALQN